MESYIVAKKVALQAKDSTYRKDDIITINDIGPDNIERFLEKGYIKPLGREKVKETVPYDAGELPFYLTAEDYLSARQVNKLSRAQLVEYAAHIGLEEFNGNIKANDIKLLINNFIEEALESDDGVDVEGYE